MKKISKFIINNKTKVLIISCILLVLSFIGMKLTTINYNILVYLPSEIDTIKGQDILTDEFNMGSYSIVVAENLSPKEILNLKNKRYELLMDLMMKSFCITKIPRAAPSSMGTQR